MTSKEKNFELNDESMVELGLRYPKEEARDPSVWNKSSKEKNILKKLRRISSLNDSYFHNTPRKSIPVKAKLIIYLKNNNKFKNTVYSTTCWQHEIDDILSRYSQYDKNLKYNKSIVIKYVYNGKTYNPEERPFWSWK